MLVFHYCKDYNLEHVRDRVGGRSWGDGIGWVAEGSKLRFLVETFSQVMYMAKLYTTV